jgi:hypothetical protein|nr:MAG TPA: ASCH domain protein [Caudoviricetes sp.]
MLTFNVKKEWFEKIKSGEKTHEYRVANPYWDARLSYLMDIVNPSNYIRVAIPCCFCLGYPARDAIGKRLYGLIRSISKLNNGLDTDLKTDKAVYDIEFELIKEKEQ